MATASLLNVDVDQIFEQHNVSEIESINRKIQAEIENKREELRMMVKTNLTVALSALSASQPGFHICFRLVRGIEISSKPLTQSLR